jgi:hypothetical protein
MHKNETSSGMRRPLAPNRNNTIEQLIAFFHNITQIYKTLLILLAVFDKQALFFVLISSCHIKLLIAAVVTLV